ncbi:hypothetical protein [Lignipirellula cremea]|uniref:KAP family P-loop domain protein n=1 Tax=Lignipirellula cremea TaxID=2528010 RepID=A0A518DPY7_9BACT|nr:hypothetical protein [Lignipirellula cremea]QDU93893.1 hypothetical protein Pla8534_16780 [Lignipirellula cremea]
MKIKQFLEHHHIERNPFAEEDAQTDPVFKELCIQVVYHPAWDKVYGDPSEPSTAVVFGEKGSGKTAMRLQIANHAEEYNRTHPDSKLYILHYDDFNPFLDRFRQHVGPRKKADKVLAQWRLWDHMDAILSIGVTGLVDRVLGVKQPSKMVHGDVDTERLDQMDRHQKRDLLLLAAYYDQSVAQTSKMRWERLRKRLNFGVWGTQVLPAVGFAWTVAIVTLLIAMAMNGMNAGMHSLWLYPLLVALGWIPWVVRFVQHWSLASGVARHVRTGNHDVHALRKILMNFTRSELTAQPAPDKDRTDDRYELLAKFQGLLQELGYHGILVLIDRVDEPHLINGSAELMKALVWPMLDNKFLKHPGLGLKLMLPIELSRFVEREEREFYQRARLDKQNMIRSFQWTGEALYDVANARMRACAEGGAKVDLSDMFDEKLTHRRLVDSLRSLRVPRHLFKFLYRLLVDHCNSHSEAEPQWRISGETFESALAVYLRDQDSFDRGVGAG